MLGLTRSSVKSPHALPRILVGAIGRTRGPPSSNAGGVEPQLRREHQQRHSYVSRAHPQRLSEYPITTALQMVLEDAHERTVERAAKWERNAPVRVSKGTKVRCGVRLTTDSYRWWSLWWLFAALAMKLTRFSCLVLFSRSILPYFTLLRVGFGSVSKYG